MNYLSPQLSTELRTHDRNRTTSRNDCIKPLYMEYNAMSIYREDIAEIISAQIQVALEKEYDRGWKECMEYYWKEREINEKLEESYDEDKDPYAG